MAAAVGATSERGTCLTVLDWCDDRRWLPYARSLAPGGFGRRRAATKVVAIICYDDVPPWHARSIHVL